MDWQFILNPDSDNLTIDEPVGWNDFENSLERDDKIHGMRFEASIGILKFFGAGAEFLREQKELKGLKANVIFQALLRCAAEDPYEEVLKGRLNFGRYKEDCGTTCFVTMPIEEDSCAVVFKNRYDQKVDIDKNTAFDNQTVLGDYAGLAFPIDLPAKNILVSAEGYVDDAGDTLTLDNFPITDGAYINIRPVYINERFNSIETGQIANVSSSFELNQLGGGPLLSPQLLMEANQLCFSGDATYNIRLKGSYDVSGNDDINHIKLRFVEFLPVDATDFISTGGTVIHEVTLFDEAVDGVSQDESGDYDQTWTGTITLQDGYGYYAFLQIAVILGDYTIINTFDPETYFNISIDKACPTTNDADGYLIHETLSRTAEAITNSCMRVKSEYYGRTDSQPFSFPSDGCGSLRMLTSGLKLRNAPEDKFFTSMKELIEGLTAIDNIGFGVEEDTTIPGKYILRVEDVEHFYQNSELLRFDFIPSATSEVEESRHYARIQVGYNKWEPEGLNGLDELLSNREYRTSLDSVSTTLDIKSNLIVGSYLYEVVRQQSFSSTGGADTKHDNDTFLICLIRDAYGYQVEQGNITNDANIYSPSTIINYRLSPLRNLMRWFKSIIPSYANYVDSDNKLFFSAGTGNLIAEGEQTSLFCKIENQVIAENQDISTIHFFSADYLPIWKNELISFEYPLSIRDYKLIKANPYGYINYQCGTGVYEKGYIKEMKYKPAQGKASFVLRKKY